MLKRIRASGLLSFGPSGIDLELKPLNVLIGPSGSGKSNLLELLALLKAAPTNLPKPVRETGGLREWLWKGPGMVDRAYVEATVMQVPPREPLRHSLELALDGELFAIRDERIEHAPLAGHHKPYILYRFEHGHAVLNEGRPGRRKLKHETLKADQSVLAQIRHPDRYPELGLLQRTYEGIGLYRHWTFGPGAAVRRAQPPDLPNDQLLESAENLAHVLQRLLPSIQEPLEDSLRRLYDGVEAYHLEIIGGLLLPSLVESGKDKPILASRLSDGTLRYLALLAVLLHPSPPPLVAIEEPELGLHPDLLHHVADLLIQASERTQLIVTTHSRGLIDALGEHPESVVVTSKEDGETRFERLDPDRMAVWLEKYSLGELWSSGELGGNRW